MRQNRHHGNAAGPVEVLSSNSDAYRIRPRSDGIRIGALDASN
jgi:hypothetical protein